MKVCADLLEYYTTTTQTWTRTLKNICLVQLFKQITILSCFNQY